MFSLPPNIIYLDPYMTAKARGVTPEELDSLVEAIKQFAVIGYNPNEVYPDYTPMPEEDEEEE